MLTVQRVSGSLRSGGFKASKSSPTGVRGCYNVSAGFRVSTTWPVDGSVTVVWLEGIQGFVNRLPTRKLVNLKTMAAFLASQGFNVEGPADDLDTDFFKVRERSTN